MWWGSLQLMVGLNDKKINRIYVEQPIAGESLTHGPASRLFRIWFTFGGAQHRQTKAGDYDVSDPSIVANENSSILIVVAVSHSVATQHSITHVQIKIKSIRAQFCSFFFLFFTIRLNFNLLWLLNFLSLNNYKYMMCMCIFIFFFFLLFFFFLCCCCYLYVWSNLFLFDM